ncbi:hypothetical protein Tco_1016268 [Tanacetum coccineum]|uniref:Uncharacterized protein n=1 Tax=Tanacetum coccineum TaxID=301880 RepID=A0ABQ5FPH7_9ASTR
MVDECINGDGEDEFCFGEDVRELEEEACCGCMEDRRELKKRFEKMMKMVKVMTIYFGGSAPMDGDVEHTPTNHHERTPREITLTRKVVYPEPTKGPKAKESQSGSSKGNKSQPKSFGKFGQSEELEFEALSEKLNWENPEGSDYPFDLTKPLPLVMSGNRQKLPVDYFFNNDLKYLQGGVSTMTYTTSITKTKVIQYDIPGIEDMVLNIWVPVKVSYDKTYVMGNLTLERTTSRFKEGNFPRLHINDIKDTLLLVVQNRLTNLSGDDVSDFAIALRMFTRSLVIQKRVEDL